MKKLPAAVAALIVIASLGAAQALPSSCDEWGCGMNGYSLNGYSINGVALNGIWSNGYSNNGTSYQGIWENGIRVEGVATRDWREPADAAQPAVTAVVLPSGEIVALR